MIASISLKELILLLLAFIERGSRYFAQNAALSTLFSSIDLPPAFTPVTSRTERVKSILIRLGFFSAG